MSKFKYILLLTTSICLFNSCVNHKDTSIALPNQHYVENQPHSYGAYIAGRVAHLRSDFNNAADYYIQALKKDPNNIELLNSVYLILTSQGRISEAATYAKEAIKLGERNNFAYIIIAADQIKNQKYKDAEKTVKKTKGVVYNDFISPLVLAWVYTGEGKKDKAIETLDIIKKEKSLRALYHFQAGMIYDYFGDNKNAAKNYEVIVKEEKLEMSFRALQIICNFYIRNNQKTKAVNLVRKYADDRTLADMMKRLQNSVAFATPKNAKKLLTNPAEGVAEAFFSIAATLRQGEAGVDLAHMFISLAIYENQDYDLARLLLADILESREMFAEANAQYDAIDKNKESYYTAQLRKANNLVQMNDYDGAELLMKSLTLESNNPQLYLDLGDVLRLNGNQNEAIEYYTKAIDATQNTNPNKWVLYYARGISYEQNNQWNLAEKDFQKALTLSQKHYAVLNYLGYSWITRGVNTELAFSMLVDAYNQAPQDGNVADSLGWAFYRLGKYDYAVFYLEKATETEAANPIICDHLGDAYWMAGRKNEARFQWQHALALKDEENKLNPDEVRAKIQTGEVFNKPLTYNAQTIQETIDLISTED